MRSTRHALLTGALLVAALTLGTGSPAAAAGPHRAPVSHPPRGVVLPGHLAPGPGARTARHVTFTNWSGFADGAGTYTGVSSTWTQPVVTCGQDEAWTVFWVGLDGFSDGTVEQDGTSAYCPGGGAAPQYDVWWEMYPTNAITTVFAIRPGDTVTATVTYQKPTFRLTVTDDTTGQSFTRNEKCGPGRTCPRSSAEWIAEAPTRLSTGDRFPLARYADVRFGRDTASSGGATRPIAGWPTYYRIDMVNKDGTVDATASALSAAGNSFTDVWRHA